jgi:hypothetical protein
MPHVFPAFIWLEASEVSIARVGAFIEGVYCKREMGVEHACVRVNSAGSKSGDAEVK